MSFNIAQTVARNARLIAKQKGISQGVLAAKIGVSQPSISSMLKGRQSMDTKSIQRLAKALGVHPCELICRDK